MTRTWRTFKVEVDGHDPFITSAPSRAKARLGSFDNYRELWPATRFGEFMRICRITVCPVPANDGYDYVRRNYGVDPKVGQRAALVNEGPSSGKAGVVIYPGLSTASVHIVLDGDDHPVRVHPMNVALGEVASTPEVAHG